MRRVWKISLWVLVLLTLAVLPAIERDARHTVQEATAQTHGDEHGQAATRGDDHGAAAGEQGAAAGEHGAPQVESHDTGHGDAPADAHGAGHGGAHEEGPPELDNILVMLGVPHGHTWLSGFVGPDQLFILFYIIILLVVAAAATKSMQYFPGALQNGVEFVVQTLDDFVCGIMGPQGRQFVPFLGTLFVFILMMNYSGLVPFLRAPTSSLNTTLALAVCVFVYVQWTGIRKLGIIGYLDHLAGSPRDVVGFVLIPLMLPLHLVGELVKPVSLSLRLFGNITGEDVLLAVFVGLGASLYAALHLPLADWLGLPLQAIVYPLLLIFGFIQALVFTLLSTIYFYMMLPHEEHH